MVSGELDLWQGTLSALVDSDRLFTDKDETIAKRKKAGEGAITLEKQGNQLIFTYINFDVGKTILEYHISENLAGYVDVEVSWSVPKQKINLFIDGELEKTIDMDVKDGANLDSPKNGEKDFFSFFNSKGIL